MSQESPWCVPSECRPENQGSLWCEFQPGSKCRRKQLPQLNTFTQRVNSHSFFCSFQVSRMGWGLPTLHSRTLSCFGYVQLFATLWIAAHQAPVSMGFSRQEYWSGLSCPPSGDLPDPGIEPASPSVSCTEGRFFIGEPPGKFMIDINSSITKQFHSWIFIQVIYCLIYSGKNYY